MALSQDDIQFIKAHMSEWLAEQSLGKPSVVYEIELRERMVRVEKALKHQGELMRQGFEQMEKRFEQMERRLSKWNDASSKATNASRISSSATTISSCG